MAIGHVRYSTTGSSEWRNAQPIHRARDGSAIALAHNGNLVNTDELRRLLLANGATLGSTSDTEVMAALLAEHPARDVKDALREVIPRLRGAFSAVLLTRDEVIGFRDPYGVRPLVLGSLDGRFVLASETAALDIIGAKAVREIAPGRDVLARRGGLPHRAGGEARSASRSASSSSSTSPVRTRQ